MATEYFNRDLVVRTARASLNAYYLGIQKAASATSSVVINDTGVFDMPSPMSPYSNLNRYDLSGSGIASRHSSGYTCAHMTMSSQNDTRSLRLSISVMDSQRLRSVMGIDHGDYMASTISETHQSLIIHDYTKTKVIVDKLQVYTKIASVAGVSGTSAILVTGATAHHVGGSNNEKEYMSFIAARVCNYDREFPELVNASTSYYTPNGIAVFDANGNIHQLHADDDGNNGSSLTSGFSDDIISANSGLTAVSCMIDVGGKAHWLGWKNGIYKIFQGPSPINGVLGERLTIKGHKFVCLANGPFYARLT